MYFSNYGNSLKTTGTKSTVIFRPKNVSFQKAREFLVKTVKLLCTLSYTTKLVYSAAPLKPFNYAVGCKNYQFSLPRKWL